MSYCLSVMLLDKYSYILCHITSLWIRSSWNPWITFYAAPIGKMIYNYYISGWFETCHFLFLTRTLVLQNNKICFWDCWIINKKLSFCCKWVTCFPKLLLVFNYVKMYESLSWSIKVDFYAKSWRYCAFIDNIAFSFSSMLVGSSCSNKDLSRERKLIYIASIQIIILQQRTKLYWLKHSTMWNIDNRWITHR